MFDIFLGPQPEKFLKKIDKELKANVAQKITDTYLEDYYNKNKEK